MLVLRSRVVVVSCVGWVVRIVEVVCSSSADCVVGKRLDTAWEVVVCLDIAVMCLAVVLQAVHFSGRHLLVGSKENRVVCLDIWWWKDAVGEAAQKPVQPIVVLYIVVLTSSDLMFGTCMMFVAVLFAACPRWSRDGRSTFNATT